MSCSSKSDLRKELWEPLIYSALVRSTSESLDFQLASEVGARLVGMSPYPVGMDAYLQVDSIRIELNL